MRNRNLRSHSMDSNSEMMLKVQANSPFNDGWTQQFYREQLEKKQSKTMSKQVDFEKYQNFVDAVTSDQSTDFVALADRLVELDEKGANIERLLTAGVGINAEGGEFLEIIKKLEKRYPGGQFDVYYSENREVGDL